MSFVKVIIPNFNEYNPRADRANYTWFRFQNDFFINQKLFGLTDAQSILFIIILCEASKKNKPEVEINIDYLAAIRKTTSAKLIKDFQILIDLGVVTPADSRQTASLLHATNDTNERTNERDVVCESGDSRHVILSSWNELVKSLPKIKVWTKSRDRAAKTLLSKQTVEDWSTACRKVEASDFLSGRNGKWTSCCVDWLLKPANMTKVLEGNYDNREVAPPSFKGMAELLAESSGGKS